MHSYCIHPAFLSAESGKPKSGRTQTPNPWLRRHVASLLGHRPQLHQWDLDLLESFTKVYMPNALPFTSELFGGW